MGFWTKGLEMIRDKSYSTVRFGEVESYDGAYIYARHGQVFLEVGRGPVGGPDWIGEHGRVEVERLPRGEEIEILVTVHSLDGSPRFNADIVHGGRVLVASPYQFFTTEQDAVDAAISRDAARLLFVRRSYVVPGYNTPEPAPSWAVAITRTLADPVSREWYAEGKSMRATIDAVA